MIILFFFIPEQCQRKQITLHSTQRTQRTLIRFTSETLEPHTLLINIHSIPPALKIHLIFPCITVPLLTKLI